MHPRPSSPRRLTLGLAVLCLLAQLSGTVHLALVSHVTCAEHGELVEPGEAWSVSAALPDRGGDGPHLAQGLALAREAAHGHDHCLATALRRASAPPERPASPEAPAPGEALAVHAAAGRALAPALPLLAVAPKASPPAA